MVDHISKFLPLVHVNPYLHLPLQLLLHLLLSVLCSLIPHNRMKKNSLSVEFVNSRKHLPCLEDSHSKDQNATKYFVMSNCILRLPIYCGVLIMLLFPMDLWKSPFLRAMYQTSAPMIFTPKINVFKGVPVHSFSSQGSPIHVSNQDGHSFFNACSCEAC